MRGNRILRAARCIVLGIAAVLVFGYVTLRLWNWLMPAVFGLHLITFWQALGLLLLAKLLFGGFRGRGGPGIYWRRRMTERWEHMTPEEREKFRAGMKGCGWGGSTPAAAASEPKS